MGNTLSPPYVHRLTMQWCTNGQTALSIGTSGTIDTNGRIESPLYDNKYCKSRNEMRLTSGLPIDTAPCPLVPLAPLVPMDEQNLLCTMLNTLSTPNEIRLPSGVPMDTTPCSLVPIASMVPMDE